MPPIVQNTPSINIHIHNEANTAQHRRNSHCALWSGAAMMIAGPTIVGLGLNAAFSENPVHMYLGFPTVVVGSVLFGAGACAVVAGCQALQLAYDLEQGAPTGHTAGQGNTQINMAPNNTLVAPEMRHVELSPLSRENMVMGRVTDVEAPTERTHPSTYVINPY